MFEPSFRGALLDYAEISFNLAEASMLGYNVPGDAKTHYENGIKANFADWGVTGVDATLIIQRYHGLLHQDRIKLKLHDSIG